MIELKIDGVCKECIFKELILVEWDANVRCRHEEVCKFVGDPHGEERYRIAVHLMREKAVEELKAQRKESQERNADA